ASWPPPSNVLKALEEFASSNSKPKTSAVDRVSWPPTDTPPISSISIFDGQILLAMPGLSLNTDQDPKEITSVELSGFEAQVDFRSWKDIFLGVKAAKANLYDRGSSYIEDAEIELRGRFKLQEFESNVFTITSKRLNSRGNFKTNIRTSKIINRNYIDSIDITIASDATANFSLLGSFLDIGGCTGDVSAKTTTKIEIPLRKDLKASLLVTGTGQSAGASLSGFNLYDSEADFTIDLDGMKFDEVRLKSKDSQFGKAKGRIGFNSKIDFDFSGKPKNLPFDMLLGVFNVPFNVVNFGLTSENLSIKGLGKPFSMNVAATSILDDFDTPATPYSHDLIPDSPVCKVNLNMDINKAGIKFEKNDGGCKRRTDHSYDGLPLNIFGHTAFNNKSGMNLNIESTNYKTLAPLSFFSQLDLTGTGSLKAIIHGPYDNIKVELDMRGGPTSIAEIPLRSVDFLGQVNSQEFLWSQVLAKTESGGQLASKGKISLNPSLDLDTDLNATQIDHVTMNKIFKKLIDKKSTLELVIDSMHSKIKGPLLNPLEYRGDVQLEASTIKDNDNMYASKFKGLIESE
ncbi:MAG: hypothetical protein NT027_01480, partial [Proteobacteria bacterium]|nr:hypothetical protein [Pseudomonadota bacterium]